MTSSFLSSGAVASASQLASLHLRRDLSIPTILSTEASSADHEGYAEGVVTNTRFGSFPHSTIIGAPWGSQILASKVDTGSRGRRDQQSSKKRKADAISGGGGSDAAPESSQLKEAITASSGFIHVLKPTPENWTSSLPHRTQVVYTPDYSYILHRIRARPGSRLIEAGSGSGSFTHAAARAVFSGYRKPSTQSPTNGSIAEQPQYGRVFTYEFHAERHDKVKQEMDEHGLSSIVHATHRDVYNEGFLIPAASQLDGESKSLARGSATELKPVSPKANAVFLDLPAPWEALPHLTRDESGGQISPLDPSSAVHICTFSPCIEQAQRTVSTLRRFGWLEIDMLEVQHKRIDIRREYTGLEYDGMRGVNAFATDVGEALSKLREVEMRAKEFHTGQSAIPDPAKSKREQNRQQDGPKTFFKGGILIHRSEPELKTHTSYLVFAVLPQTWTEENEEAERLRWLSGVKIKADVPKSQRQLKKEAKQRAKAHATAGKKVASGQLAPDDADRDIEDVVESGR